MQNRIADCGASLETAPGIMNLMDSSLLANLNDPQRQAVLHTEGPLLIFAGAGSGKTSVLTRRIAYLIAECGVRPYNVVAVTFTNKAATEMKDRITALVGDVVGRDLWAGTFHSICARMLRERGDEIDIDRRFTIYDDDDQMSLVKEIMADLQISDKSFQPRAILSQISHAKEKLSTPRELWSGPYISAQDRAVASVYDEYQKRLREAKAQDFDDLIVNAVALLKNSDDARAHYQRRFRYVHCDEFQDTNKAQYMLLRLFSMQHGNLCVVGDDDQSIYAFRGADVGIILDFKIDFPDAQVIKLEQNYRSTKTILDAAYHVVKNNKGRADKRLWTDKGDGDHIILIETSSESEEARAIAGEIRRLTGSGDRRYSDIAILYRTNAQSRAIEEQLNYLGIKYRIVGGLKFWARKEIKDIVAYLRGILNPYDSISLRRVINVPVRGIGAGALAAVNAFASENGQTFWDSLRRAAEIELPKRSLRAIDGFVKMMEYFRTVALKKSPSELIMEILDTSGYMDELRKETTENSRSRQDNVGELVTVATRFREQQAREAQLFAAAREDAGEDEDPFADVQEQLLDDYPQDLALFLQNVALLSEIDSYEEGANSVTLMTLHSAKGLEFPVVFLSGLEEGVFPHARAFESAKELEEERRLCYVGITRAKEKLYMSYAETRAVFGMTRRSSVSRFVAEIPQPLFIPIGMRPAPLAASTPTIDFTSGRTLAPVAPRWADVAHPAQAAAGVALPFKAGDKVQHKVFGRGTVVNVTPEDGDAKVSVAFPAPVGIKTLMASFARLEKTT